MPTTINLSNEFLDGYNQSTDTAIENLADLVNVEMRKLAPFAKPSQYLYGYPGTPGSLVKSLTRKGKGKRTQIVSSVAYAIRRNYENNLNPQTTHYIERGIDNVLRGQQSRWWQAERK